VEKKGRTTSGNKSSQKTVAEPILHKEKRKLNYEAKVRSCSTIEQQDGNKGHKKKAREEDKE